MLGYRLEAVELKNNLSLPQSKLMLPLSSHLGKSDIRLLADPTVQTTTSILWCFPSLKQLLLKTTAQYKSEHESTSGCDLQPDRKTKSDTVVLHSSILH